MGPNFICIGGQRCGTTWLHHVLNLSPEIWTSPVKELHHFDVQAGLTPDNYRYRRHLRSRLKHYGRAGLRVAGVAGSKDERLEPAWDRRYFSGERSDDWYASLFADDVAKGRLRGETTPAYSILPAPDIARIARRFSDLKVLITLRDPVERAWSAALREPGVDRADTAALIAHMRSPGCVARSDWGAILANWRGAFPAEQVGVFDFATLRAAPAEFLREIGGFLGVRLTQSATSGSRRKVNASSHRKGAPPPQVLAAVRDLYAPLIDAAAEASPASAGAWTRHWPGAIQAAE